VIAADALGALWEAVRLQGKIIGIFLLDGKQLLNVHIAEDSILAPDLTQQSVDDIMLCLHTVVEAAWEIVSEERMKVISYWEG
jgi:hypothetical protein